MCSSDLKGHWIGTLDYRDYGNDGRTVLPTTLDADGASLSWTYDDGAGKNVRSIETWTFDPTEQTLTIRDGKSVSRAHISELRKSLDGGLTMVIDGSVTENGKKGFSRMILTLDKGTLRLTQLSRTPRAPFLMRHSYELRR